MLRKSKSFPTTAHEFVLHESTGRVGLVTDVSIVDGETHKTIRLAGGDLVSAPAREFRPATGPEIECRHRLAASVKPLDMPIVPLPHSRPNEPRGRIGS